jgi:hypothetical protein
VTARVGKPFPTNQRDRWDRPKIIPPEGGEPVSYVRVSKIAKALDDLNMLMAWKARKTAEGLIRRPDLLTRVSGVIAKGNPDTDHSTKRALNAICDEAQEAAGTSKGASAGTGFHDLTEAIDSGREPLFVGAEDQRRLDAYIVATRNIEWLDIECFVVNDIVRAAGTFDRLGRLPDGRVVVADLKSGKSEAEYPFGTTVQIATYANGQRYDYETGERTPLHEDLDLTSGILIHMPPTGGCALYELDLVRGWEAAQLAVEVARMRKWKNHELARPIFFDEDATLTQEETK